MFHKFILTTFFICTIDLIYSQSCQEDINKFFDCILDLKDKQDKIVQTEVDRKRNKEKECFTKNKCKDPVFEKIKPATTDDPVLEKRKQCRVQLTEKAQNLTKECVNTKLGITFPVIKRTQNNQHPISLISQVRLLCPDNETMDTVFDCLRDNISKTVEERANEKKLSKNRFNEFCSKKQECFSKNLSKDCQNKFNQTHIVRCECAKKEIKSKEDDLNKEFFACANIKSGPEKDMVGLEVDDIIDQACKQKDPCHKSTQSETR